MPEIKLHALYKPSGDQPQEIAELVKASRKAINVSQYWTAMSSKEELEEKLHLAIQKAKIQLEQRKE